MNDWSILSATQVTEVEICRNNLFAVFRLSIKSVIDLYFVNMLNENSPELHNFLVIFEKILFFNFKASSSAQSPWQYIKFCDSMLNSKSKSSSANGIKAPGSDIFNQVESLETKTSTDRTRLRIWARLCLMHKSFAHHFRILSSQSYDVISTFYGQMSMFHLKDEMSMICDDLLGLNALDLTFQLKGENFLDYVYIVDYSSYLRFSQCHESQMVDNLEAERLKQSRLNQTGANVNGASINGNLTETVLGDGMTIHTEEFEDDLLGFSRGDTLINEDSSFAINMMLNDHLEAISVNDPKHQNGNASPPPPIGQFNGTSTSHMANGVSSPVESANGSDRASRCASSIVSSSSNLFVELVNQKSYLEELLSNRDSKIEEMKLENGRLVERLGSSSSETEALVNQYEDIILELQQQVMDLQQQLSVAKKSKAGSFSCNSKSQTHLDKSKETSKKTIISNHQVPGSSRISHNVHNVQRITSSESGKKVAAPL